LSYKIIIFKTFYYRGKTAADNNNKQMNIENKETDKPELTEEEIQGIYMYLSMHYEQMTQEEKNTWIVLMNQFDPEFNNFEDD
jgi:hypothetical protein